MKPDYPRPNDAAHVAHVAQNGQDWGDRMLQLRERDYWRVGVKQCLILTKQIIQGIELNPAQEAKLADLEEYLEDDNTPFGQDQPGGGQAVGRQ